MDSTSEDGDLRVGEVLKMMAEVQGQASSPEGGIQPLGLAIMAYLVPFASTNTHVSDCLAFMYGECLPKCREWPEVLLLAAVHALRRAVRTPGRPTEQRWIIVLQSLQTIEALLPHPSFVALRKLAQALSCTAVEASKVMSLALVAGDMLEQAVLEQTCALTRQCLTIQLPDSIPFGSECVAE